MIPAKTKRSGIRQHMTKKIHKWGFKNFVTAGKCGMIYDFFIYAGQKVLDEKNAVLRILFSDWSRNFQRIETFRYSLIIGFLLCHFFLNYEAWAFLITGTFRSNRLAGCPLMVENDLMKQGCGSFDYRTDQNSGTHLIKCYDYKCVILGSTFSGVECTDKVERCNQTEKKESAN